MSKLLTPKIEPWMDEDEIKFRASAHEILKSLDKHLPPGTKYQFQYYFPSGISSLAALVRINGEDRVVKTSRWPQNILREAKFLQTWDTAGIPTPTVHSIINVSTEEFETITVLIMDYVTEKTAFHQLEHKPEAAHTATWQRIGQLLAQMHQIVGAGFGKALPPDFTTGEYSEFATAVTEHLLSKKKWLLLEEKGYNLAEVSEIAKALSEKGGHSCITHHDLGLHNVLGVDEDLVVFDPDPTIDLPLIDLATSYIWAVIQSGLGNAEEMVNSYLSERKQLGAEDFNRALFEMALQLRLLSKHAVWLSKPESEVSRMCLEKTKPLISLAYSTPLINLF